MPTLGSISPCQDASSSLLSFLLAGAWGIPVPVGIASTSNLPLLKGSKGWVSLLEKGKETQSPTATSHIRIYTLRPFSLQQRGRRSWEEKYNKE